MKKIIFILLLAFVTCLLPQASNAQGTEEMDDLVNFYRDQSAMLYTDMINLYYEQIRDLRNFTYEGRYEYDRYYDRGYYDDYRDYYDYYYESPYDYYDDRYSYDRYRYNY